MSDWTRRGWMFRPGHPCEAYVPRRGAPGLRPCRRTATGYSPANTPACWQHQRPLKRWAAAQRGATR